MSLGTLTIDLAANVARLSSDLGKANRLAEKSAAQMERRFSQMKTALGTMFAGLSVGAFATWIKQSIDAADQVNELSQKINVNAESLQKWGFAASVSGGSMEDTATAIKKLSVNISEAASGSDSAKAKFDAIGVSFLDSSGKIRTADSVMLDISDRFQSTANDANKTAIAIDLFGKSGTSMIPVLNEGSASLQEMMQQAQDLGLVMSQESLTAADNFNDSLTTLVGVSRGYANHIAEALLPTLNTLTGYLISTATESEDTSEKFLVLNNTIKILTSTAIGVAAAFDIVGKRLGAAMASIAAIAEGEFSKSVDIINMANEDAVKIMETASSKIDKVWSGAYENIGKKAVEVEKKVKPSIINVSAAHDNLSKSVSKSSGHVDKAAQAAQRHADAIANEVEQLEYKVATLGMTNTQEQLYKLTTEGATQAQIEHSKVLLDQIDVYDKNTKAQEDAKDYQERLNDMMRQYDEEITGAKSGTVEYGQKLADLSELLNAGKINQDEYNAAVRRVTDEYDDAGKSAIDWSEVMTDAAKSGKDALADFLYDPLGSGFDDMVGNFTEALRKMSAQAAAAGIMDSIFNKDTMSSITSWFSSLFSSSAGGSAGGAGLLSSITGSIGSMFSFDGGGYTGSGARSGGLDGKGGFMAMIHPNEQIIDYTKPQTASAQQYSGSSSSTVINQVINTTGRIDRKTSNQIASDSAKKQRLARARFGA